VFLFSPCHGLSLHKKFDYFLFFWIFVLVSKKNSILQTCKRAPGNTNTGEGVKGKKVRTTSDDAGGKSVSEKSKSTGGKCVSENSTGGKSGTTRTSNNTFEASRSEKPV